MNKQESFTLGTVNLMRKELLNKKKELTHYKELYSQVVKEKNEIQRQLAKSKKLCGKLQNKIDDLSVRRTKSGSLKERKRKSCEGDDPPPSKKVRNDLCRRDIQTALQILPDWKSCCVQVKFSNVADLNMVISKQCEAANKTSTPDIQQQDHSYCHSKSEDAGNELIDPFLKSDDIYDADGNFTQRHIRKAVMVTDNYRISNDAYHEIRSELSGHMPPVGQLKQEKAVMSEEIPYQKHPSVCTILI